MQSQDASGDLIFKLWPWLEANKMRLIGAGVAIVVIAGVLYFVSAQKAQSEVEAGEAFTATMLAQGANTTAPDPTQFETLAQKYSGTAAGHRAQLQAAGLLFEAGKYPEAQAQFENYLKSDSSGALAATAELGVAASLDAQNQLDAAAAAYQRVISVFADSACVATAQLALGRIAEKQNKLTEAANHYEDAARGGMGGSISQEAMLRNGELKARMAAASNVISTNKPAAATPLFTPTAQPAK